MKTLSNLNSLISSLLILVVITLFITPAYSLINSITAPTTVLHPGQNFTVTFHTVDYIQNNLQFYSVFGVAPYPGFGESFLGIPVPVVAPHPGADGGTQGGVDLLVAGLNSHLGKFNVTLNVPSSLGGTNVTKKYTLQTGVLGNVSKIYIY